MASHIERWKAEWRRFAAQNPGRRFLDRYERRRDRRGRSWWRKAANLGGGVLLLLVGLFFAVAPGPAVVFFALGGLLLAKESRLAARCLDWIDRLLEPLLGWARSRWHRLSPRVRRVAAGCVVVWTVGAIVLGLALLR